MLLPIPGKLNLIVDPNVLKGGQLADMHLRNVTLREGFNEVLRTYDVSGEFRGNTLRVNLTEEKFFALNFLNTKTSLQMGSGGNVFGGGTSGGARTAAARAAVVPTAVAATRGRSKVILTLTGSGGSSTDPYQDVEGALKAILGDNAHIRAAPSRPSPATDNRTNDGPGRIVHMVGCRSGSQCDAAGAIGGVDHG